MKISVLIVAMVLAVLFMSGDLYAANGDLIVNGNLGVGTGTAMPAGKAEVNGNMIVDGNLGVGTTTPQTKLDVNGGVHFDPNTTWTSAEYGGSMLGQTVNLGYHSFCALGSIYILHKDNTSEYSDVVKCVISYDKATNTWQLTITQYNNTVTCQAICLN